MKCKKNVHIQIYKKIHTFLLMPAEKSANNRPIIQIAEAKHS